MISNYQLFHPVNTGAPRQDVYNHVARLPQNARIDFEEHTLAGNLIMRIEAGLGRESETEAESKIVAVPYATRRFGNTADAMEFVRCVKLIAGDDARAYNLQVIAAHYYQEARTRPVSEVLKEMALLSLELGAVTATSEVLLLDEAAETSQPRVADEWLTAAERRELWERRAAQILDEPESGAETGYFAAELKSLSRLRQKTAGFVADETAGLYAWQSAALAAAHDDPDEAAELFDAFASGYEQYDEGHVVSLHMSDGERVVVVGALDDDIDEDSLPQEARHLAARMYELYTSGFPLTDAGAQARGEGLLLTAYKRNPRTGERDACPVEVFGLDTWLDYAVDELYPGRVLRTARQLFCAPLPNQARRTVARREVVSQSVPLTQIRQGQTVTYTDTRHTVRHLAQTLPATRLHEQTSVIEVCPDAEERARTRAVLETLLTRWQADCHTRGLHSSADYRDLTRQLAEAHDTAVIARLKREAWQHKEQARLSLKLFTSWLTRAKVRKAALISAPLKAARQINGETRTCVIAQPLLRQIPQLSGATINAFNRRLSGLPRQEQNRVRAAVAQGNAPFYHRLRDGLSAELRQSSASRLRYFKWAFYGANKPEHPFHLLTPEDKAATWALLHELSQTLAQPTAQPVTQTASNTQEVRPLPARATTSVTRAIVRVRTTG